jgi:nucleotide-binding universal stress UspA family protein
MHRDPSLAYTSGARRPDVDEDRTVHNVNTILVGYDDKEPAKRALAHAIEEAKSSGARLVILVVAEMPLNPQGIQNYGTLDDSPPVMTPLEPPDELQAALDHARTVVEAAGLDAEYVWSAGDPSGEIVGVARDRQVDLVVLGEHHHGGLARFFGGDVAAEVERELGASVVVVE